MKRVIRIQPAGEMRTTTDGFAPLSMWPDAVNVLEDGTAYYRWANFPKEGSNPTAPNLPRQVIGFQHDPAAIPATPKRSYRLYTEDGTPLAGWYSVEGGKFIDEGRLSPLDPSRDITVEKVRTEIESCRALFGPVTLRALTAP